MMTAVTSGGMNLEDVMRYELCSYPPAIFESQSMLRKPNKSQLAQAIIFKYTTAVSEESDNMNGQKRYILDGGSLLHRIPWRSNDTYGNIAKSYVEFTLKTYGKSTVIFDGYNKSPTIKDVTHRRRGTKTSRDVNFSPNMKFIGKKEQFLSNESNKQKMILLIGNLLRQHGCTVYHADGDADVDIALAVVSSSEGMHTTVIGEDTDLLILLLHHAKDNGFKLYYRSDIKRKTGAAYSVQYSPYSNDSGSRKLQLAFVSARIHWLRYHFQDLFNRKILSLFKINARRRSPISCKIILLRQMSTL